MLVIMEEVKGGNADAAFSKREKTQANGVNGRKEISTEAMSRRRNSEERDLRVPNKVIEEGVKIVRGVLDLVVDVGDDRDAR